VFFLQPGELSFQVADPLAQAAQFVGDALVRPADVAEKSLSHDGRSSLPSWHHARLKARCTTDGDRMEKGMEKGTVPRQRGGLMIPAEVKRAAVRPKSAADSCLTKATAAPPLAGCPALLS